MSGFELIACTCAVRRKTTGRAEDVFMRMRLANQRRHDIAYNRDSGFPLEKQFLPIFIPNSLIVLPHK
jgi:hypothetical protein